MRLLRAIVPLLHLLPVLVLPGCGLPQAVGLNPDRSRATAGDPEAIAYRVEIDAATTAELGRRLRGLLERSSQLIALKDRPPFTAIGLKRRIDGDIERFQDVLRSEGYYRASVNAEVDREATPPKVRLIVDPGPPFRLESFSVGYVTAAGAPPAPLPEAKDLGVELGAVARAPAVVAGEKAALRFLANRGHPLARIADRKIVVDHATRTMRVGLDLDPGPEARFGAVSVAGLDGVEEDYVRVLIPWREGDPYDQRLVDRYRTRLLRTGLFSAVSIDRGEALAEGEVLPVDTRLVEGKQRSVGFGVRYSTGEGPAVKVFWEHRNLLGRNEDLGVAVEVGGIEQSAEVRFVRPDFRLPEQDLFIDAVATRTNSTAFNELSLETSAGLERPLAEDWTGSLAASLEWARLDDQEGSRTSTLAGLPGWLYYDGANDLYNPTKGVRLRLATTPYAGWFDKTVGFLVSEATGSAYVPIDESRRFVLAGRLRAGSIAGQPRDDVPANKRFYAGGGDSIRGYKFQEVGPIDDDNDPLGGRSLFETSLELRTRVWGNLGVVSFVEGGNVFEAEYPDFADPLRWAAGGGLRYFTPIGPVRLDIAFPLNRREDIDDPFQFYIALGEAF
jgi:translocation and assembly module TamA